MCALIEQFLHLGGLGLVCAICLSICLTSVHLMECMRSLHSSVLLIDGQSYPSLARVISLE